MIYTIIKTIFYFNNSYAIDWSRTAMYVIKQLQLDRNEIKFKDQHNELVKRIPTKHTIRKPDVFGLDNFFND